MSEKKKTRGSVAVYETLREDVLTLRLEPGSAIDEVDLAKRFGLSRTPVREALLMLASEQLVTFLPNRTSIVAPHSMENANDYLDSLTLLSRAVFRQSVLRANDADTDLLSKLLNALEQAIGEGDEDAIESKDLAVRNHVCKTTRNFFYLKYFPNCVDFGRRMMRLHYYPTANQNDLFALHKILSRLPEAIRTGDLDLADKTACAYVDSIIEVLKKSIDPRDARNITLAS